MGAAVAFLEVDQLVRRLAAVLAIDLVGYTRMMERDEAGTHLAVKALRASLIDPAIVNNNGRIVKYTGDGFLAEFPDALDAVIAAITIQRGMVREEAIAFRVGVNVGDIIIEPEDIYGDGVNIASRLESVAEPGGIAISQAVHEQVRNNLSVVFDDLGELHVKNIARALRAYALSRQRLAELPADPFGAETEEGRKGLAQVRRPADFAHRLSIAVLPFDNMSSDPEQSYFADGVVEDIIAALSRFKNLFIIARNASFVYKGRAVDIRQVGRELNVRYVVEGSVRRVANRLRITAQLIDASSGAHLWADWFDGGIEDVFALQNKVTQGIVTAVEPRVKAVEIERSKLKPLESLDAYDLYLRGLALRADLTYASFQAALEMFERSVKLDPHYGPALANIAHCIGVIRDHGWIDVPPADIARAVNTAQRAVGESPNDPEVLAFAAHTMAALGADYGRSLALVERALELNPNYGVGWARGAMINVYARRYVEAIAYAQRARPLLMDAHPMYIAVSAEGLANLFLDRPDDALICARQNMASHIRSEIALLLNIYALASGGRVEDTKAAGRELLARQPHFTIGNWRRRTPFTDPLQRRTMENAMRQAGVPD